MERFPLDGDSERRVRTTTVVEGRQSLTRLLLFLSITPLCLSAVVSIAILLFGEFGETEGKILMTAMALAGFSLAGLVLSVRIGRKPTWLGPVGLGLALVGFLLMAILIWASPDGDFLERITFTVVVLVVAAAHAALLLPRRDDVKAVSRILIITLVSSSVLSVMIIVPILFSDPSSEFYFRVLGVVAVVVALGTLLVPILRRGEKSPKPVARTSSTSVLVEYDRAGLLRFTYNGHTFVADAILRNVSTSMFELNVWEVVGSSRVSVAMPDGHTMFDDPHSALAYAVEQVTRKIDLGSTVDQQTETTPEIDVNQ